YDQLFIQSDFSVVLKGSIKLYPNPEMILGYLIPVTGISSLDPLLKCLMRLRIMGIVQGIPAFSDAFRVLLPEFPISTLISLSPVERAQLCNQRGIGEWNLFFSVMGETNYVIAIKQYLGLALNPFPVIVASDNCVTTNCVTTNCGSTNNPDILPYMGQCLNLLRNRIPHDFDWSSHLHIHHQPLNNTGEPGLDGCGIIFVTTATPIEAEAFYTVESIVRKQCKPDSIAYTIQAFHVKGMTLCFYIRLCYDRLTCDINIIGVVHRLQEAFISAGYALLRTSHLDNHYFSQTDQAIHTTLKNAFDPQGLLKNSNFAA
ncbi:MAG: hypothetical protein ACRC5A_08095, partial [Enterobacteriaceae bacterium]